jgi:hypothetical protein
VGSRLVSGLESSSVAVSHADAVRIREALRDVLDSAPFRGSRQCQLFLTYVVERTLAGENDLLRERVIGAEVFGRTPDYEPGDDPVVRVRASEVRKRLAQYYQTYSDGVVRIDIPPGSYKAIFQWTAGQIVTPPAIHTRKHMSRRLWAAVALLAIIAVGVAAAGLHSSASSALDKFWAPAITSQKPILVYNATTTVFHSPSNSSARQDFVPVRGQYTCIGDAYTSVVLGSLFARKGKLYQMRYGADLTFGDLRYQPSILIGAFNDTWTLQMTNELRFVFEKHPTIRDRSDNRLYTPPDLQPDGRTTDDYAIVSRVFDSKSGELLIAAAGITQYGTRAAGEFLTSAPLMAAVATNAPGDWPRKNLQVLLHTKIVDDTPGPPSIVQTYFW